MRRASINLLSRAIAQTLTPLTRKNSYAKSHPNGRSWLTTALYSFRMMGDTLVECCHADSNQKDTPCQVPGTGRETSEPAR